MNMLLNSMKQASNFTYTENGAITHNTTESALLDMFAMGGAMRQRSVGDVTLMFKKAYQENISLKEACVNLGFFTAERFDEVFHPEQMI